MLSRWVFDTGAPAAYQWGGGVSGPQQGGEGASAQHLVEPLALGAAALGSSALLGGLHLEDQPSLIWDSPARDRT